MPPSVRATMDQALGEYLKYLDANTDRAESRCDGGWIVAAGASTVAAEQSGSRGNGAVVRVAG